MQEKVINEKCCFYCGDDSQITRDHVIPVSYSGGKRHYDKNDTVDCCLECNTMLGNVSILTVEGRADYLYSRVYNKYKKYLKTPSWSDAELDELSYELRKPIIASVKIREYAQRRMAHLLKVSMSIYDDSEIKHLVGIATRDKVLQYRILSMISSTSGIKKDEAVETICNKLGCSAEDVLTVWSKKGCEDIWITWLSERRFPFDLNASQLRRLMSLS